MRSIAMLAVALLLGAAYAANPVTSLPGSNGADLNTLTRGYLSPAPAGEDQVIAPAHRILSPTDLQDIDTLHWDGPNNDGIGLRDGGTFWGAVRFTPNIAYSLTNVLWYCAQQAPSRAVVYVWGAGTPASPGPLLDTIVSTTGTGSWHNVSVPERLLPIGQDFWVGVRVTHAASEFPLGVDAGPQVPQRGGYISGDGSGWDELYRVGLDYNWNIRAVVRVEPMPDTDVGVEAVLAPTRSILPGDVTPIVRIRNLGNNPQSNIPVHIVIDGTRTSVYTAEATYAGPLAPGTTAEVRFAPDWEATEGRYNVTSWTALAGDENPANDTARAEVDVTGTGWMFHSQLPTPMMDLVACATEDYVYVVSGYNRYDPEARVMTRLATGSRTWEPMARSPLAMANGGAAILGDTLYYMAGYSYTDGYNRLLDTMMKYSISSNRWSIAPGPYRASPKYNFEPTVVAAAGKVYYISGCEQPGATNPTTRVWAYTPGEGWGRVADINMGRVWPSAWVYNDTIWVAGGLRNTTILNQTEFYCTQSNTWTEYGTQFPPLPYGHFAGGSGIVGNIGFIAGGVNQNMEITDSIMYFNYDTRAWSVDRPVLTNVYRTTAVGTPDGKALMIGGSVDMFEAVDTVQYAQFATPGVKEDPQQLRATIESVRPSIIRDRAVVSYSVNRTGTVDLSIYDVSGKLVRTLVRGQALPGRQTAVWNRTDDNGRRVSNGAYFYRLTVDGRTHSAKSVVLD